MNDDNEYASDLNMGPIQFAKYCKEIKKRNIQSFYLAKNHIGGEGIKCLFELLLEIEIETLVLVKNSLSSDDAKYLWYILASNRPLKGLSVRSNPDIGMKWITSGIAKNTVLTYLDLGGIKMETSQFRELCDVISKNTTLTELELDFCKLGNEINYFINVMKNNKTLKIANFTGNDVIALDVFDGIHISEIDLSYNKMNYDSIMRVCESFLKNDNMSKLNINENGIVSSADEEKLIKFAATAKKKIILNMCITNG